MAPITIYQKPTCSTCRQVLKLVQESGQAFTAVNYYQTPLSKTKLKALLKKGGLKARDVLRAKEEKYKALGLAKADKSEDELIELMVANPDLLQRPLVEQAQTVILARPAETVKQLWKGS
ncbi:MAG: arsenate reductase [Nitrospira sp.]|nr:arsenate reductase [Nitrospira sp.]MDE0405191.1 arsenate reductase [Nitrospira sp.]MDE0486213.1 arsenate reductase [Nitrospira sp.]